MRSFSTWIPAASQAPHRFDPAKDFFHPLADALAGLGSALGGGTRIQAGEVHAVLAGDVRHQRPCPARAHEIFPVIRLVRADGFDRDAWVEFLVGVHGSQRHHRLGFGDRVVPREVGAQAVPVLHQKGPAKTELRCFAVGLPIPHALGISRALGRVVAALFPAEVHTGIAGVFVLGGLDFLRIRTVLAEEAFQTGPRLDERAVGGEVFVARPALLTAQIIDLGQEEFGPIGGKDTLVVLGKDAGVKAAFAELAVKEPKPEPMVAEWFGEDAFTADRVKGLEHAGLEPLFRRDAGAAQLLVEIVEQWRKLLEDGVHAPLDGPQGMLGGHTLVEVKDAQKVWLGLRFPAQVLLTRCARPSSIKPKKRFSPNC